MFALESSTPNGQFQSLPVLDLKLATLAPDHSLQISKRIGKRKAVDDDEAQSPEPRFPTEHKRRRPNSKVGATPSPVGIFSHVSFDPRSASAPSGILPLPESTFAPGPEWNHALRAASLPASLPVNFSMDAAPEQSRMVENFQPDPASVDEFLQFHQSSTFNQSHLSTVNTNRNLIAPSYDTQFFEFGLKSPTDSQFPISNGSSSSRPFHDLTSQRSPSRNWSPSQQTSPHRSISPEAGERAAAREEIQRRLIAAEEEVRKLKRLEEEVAQVDDIDLATFALAQAAQHL